MQSIHQIKANEVLPAPLLLFDCVLPSGETEHWSTHRATFDGVTYAARVLRHNVLEFRAGSEDGIDTVSKVTVLLANADSRFSQIARNRGLKGARLRISFVFYDLTAQEAVSDSTVLFQGVCNPPDEITESAIRLTFNSRMNAQRIALPDIRVQRRCPWMFPGNDVQRQEAVEGGAKGKYSPFFKCGYSPDQPGGCGNSGPSGAYTSCDYTRAQCIERGMFDTDSQGRPTRRFGGIEFVPSSIAVKTYGENSAHLSGGIENESKYNDFVPLIYGTAWYRPPIVFARNDGNLTRMEVLLGCGELNDVLKVVVNGIELPAGGAAPNPTATGWYNVVTHGAKIGGFNLDFMADSKPAGDPYGSMAMMSVVVPNRIADGTPLPTIEVLVEGLKLATFDEGGTFAGEAFTNNPAWILLDLMRRSGWTEEEVDLSSFARAATYCSELVDTTDLNGQAKQIPRFQCNLSVRRRRSAADLIRGVRNGSGLLMTYGAGGKLQLVPESSLAIQQPERPAGSNSVERLDGGWPAYEFGDGTSSFSDILCRSNGEPLLRVWCRSTAETPNRYTAEFQDEFNEYQQDSLSLADLEDTVTAGQEISAALPALGLPNFNQAARIMRLALDRSIRGNTYVDFETGVRSLGLKPGDLITLTYAKEGLARQPFRIVRIAPGLNAQTSAITAQWHDNSWYSGPNGTTGSGGREVRVQPGVPRPLSGTHFDEDGNPQFDVTESYRKRADGAWDVDLEVGFVPPSNPGPDAPALPLLSLAPEIATAGGSLQGGRSYYYAVSAVGPTGAESPLSFIVRAAVPEGSDTNTVTLQSMSFGAGTDSFHVYRGNTPGVLARIAEEVPVGSRYTDSGSTVTTAAPPDATYDHGNFYWRFELQSEHVCTMHTPTSIGNDALGMLVNEYRTKIVRICRGKGYGQERVITSNDSTALIVAKPWEVEPDATSSFVVVEASWNFGAVSKSSPAAFTVPNRQNTAIQICGRSANVADKECAIELSPVTRHVIGGAADDEDVPDVPLFALSCTGRGTVEVAGIGFVDLTNTRSITAGSLSLHTWNELNTDPPFSLSNPLNDSDTYAIWDPGPAIPAGALLQIGSEVVVVKSVVDRLYDLQRGAYGTHAIAHVAGTRVFPLERTRHVLPFVKGFFGTPASGSYSHTVSIPCRRIVVAEMFVTNVRGNSQVNAYGFADLDGGGLRTLSGGQIALQVDGPLTVQSQAVPQIQCDTARSIGQVWATVNEPPVGGSVKIRVNRNSEGYCDLEIEAGQSSSQAVDGSALPPLDVDDFVGLDIIEVPQGAMTSPGAGLTVTIRF